MTNKEQLKPPSVWIEDAICDSGSLVIDCELCFRTHFADSSRAGDWEEGELETLRGKQSKRPDRYIGHECDSVSWGTIEGKQAVIDCPCNGLRRYEDWIWANRRVIAKYLRKRSEAQFEEAIENLELAKEANKSIEDTL